MSQTQGRRRTKMIQKVTTWVRAYNYKYPTVFLTFQTIGSSFFFPFSCNILGKTLLHAIAKMHEVLQVRGCIKTTIEGLATHSFIVRIQKLSEDGASEFGVGVKVRCAEEAAASRKRRRSSSLKSREKQLVHRASHQGTLEGADGAPGSTRTRQDL